MTPSESFAAGSALCALVAFWLAVRREERDYLTVYLDGVREGRARAMREAVTILEKG